jgi:hypothetical protein
MNSLAQDRLQGKCPNRPESDFLSVNHDARASAENGRETAYVRNRVSVEETDWAHFKKITPGAFLSAWDLPVRAMFGG